MVPAPAIPHLPPHTHLPQLLQLVDLLRRDLACAQLLLLRWDLDEPRQEAAVLDERLPLRAVPVDVLEAALAGAGLTAQQHHHRVGLGGDEAQQEDVAAAAVVALEHRLTQRPLLVQRHLLALGPHQVVHDVAVAAAGTGQPRPWE